MTAVQQVLPTAGETAVGDIVTQLRRAPTIRPFNDEIVDFCASFATLLRRRSPGRPESQALAYWMRPAQLRRLSDDFAALADHRTVLVPRGTVLHLPPTNVDTVFVYSWIMSALVGNRNIVRLPRRAGDQALAIVETLREVLAEGRHPAVSAANLVVSYDPDRTVTDALSAMCDLRVIWGGDATVAEIRRSPLAPRATELTFPDRFSLAAVAAGHYLGRTESERDAVVERFFNDAYQFDQLGCSSPRLIVWVGTPRQSDEAAEDFFPRLAQLTARRQYRLDPAGSIGKLGYLYRSVLDLAIESVKTYGDHVSVLTAPSPLRGDFCGGGVFFQLRVDALLDLVNTIEIRDQTLTQFGFARDELFAFARALNGRGIDRIVPVGEALTFDRIWDGHDLLQAFARRTTIDLGQVHLT